MSDTTVGPIVLDLTDVADQPPAEGWHFVEIEDVSLRTSSQKKVPQIAMRARIVDEADEDFGRVIFWNLQLEGKGRIFTKRCLKALGFDVDNPLNFADEEAMKDALVGRQVNASVTHRVYKGEIRANVNSWRAPDYGLELDEDLEESLFS